MVLRYGDRVEFIDENFGESVLARRHGITRYPAVFVNDALIARPRDFYSWGSEESGRYMPWSEARNHDRFQTDLTQMIDMGLAGRHLDSVRLDRDDAAAFPIAALPEFLLVDLEGLSLHSTQMRDKVTVVEFWAPWCPPCRSTLRWLGDLERRHGDALTVIAAAVASEEQQVRQMAAELDLPIHLAMAPDSFVQQFGTITAIPTLFVFDAMGRTASVFFGAPEDLHEKVGAVLDSLLTPGLTSLVSVQSRLAAEIARLRDLVASGAVGSEMAAQQTRITGLLSGLEKRARSGEIYSTLQQLRGLDVQIAAAAYAHTNRALRQAGMDAFEDEWLGVGPKLQDAGRERRLPVAVEALRQVSALRARNYYHSSLPYARADSVRSGLYYLGIARAYNEFAVLCAGMEFTAVAPAPDFLPLDRALTDLESEAAALFASAGDERKSELHSLNSSLKEARELERRGEHAGAMARLLDGQLRMGDFLGHGAQAELSDLRRAHQRFQERLNASTADHSLAALYLELSSGPLRDTDAQEAALRRSAIILEDVLPAYFSLLQ